MNNNTQSDTLQILDVLDYQSKHIDEICRELNWPVSRVSAALGLLELRGVAEREAGMRFRLAADTHGEEKEILVLRVLLEHAYRYLTEEIREIGNRCALPVDVLIRRMERALVKHGVFKEADHE